jgi:hypothetical protein
MSTIQLIPRKLTASAVSASLHSGAISLACPAGRFLGRALSALAALAILLSPAAFGADPAKEMTKVETNAAMDPQRDSAVSNEPAKVAASRDTETRPESPLSKAMTRSAITGGMDPHGDSWLSIQHSFQQFAQPGFMLRLFLGLSLAVACSCAIAWHPRGSRRIDPLSDLEERKAFIILGVVGAIVAELSGASPTLAFVIFGIGALLRFRTVLDNPKATGKAILVVVIGLACGMGSWTMAVFVTAFSWVLIFWLDSHLTCIMAIRLDSTADPKPVQGLVHSLLLSHRCRIQSCELSKSKKRMEFLFHMPAGLDRDKLEADVKAKLPKTSDSRITIRVV